MNQELIPGGYFVTARKLFSSELWKRPPLYLKLWLWIVGNANHSDSKDGKVKRGQLITSYSTMTEALKYYQNRQSIFPTIKQLRIILQWLEDQGMITVIPLKATDSGTSPNLGRHHDQTRAYIGLSIHVVNYDTYQDVELYRGRHKGRASEELGHINNNDNKNVKRTPADFSEIQSLEERYFDRNLINKCFNSISSTRKTKRISDSVKLNILHQWNNYPADQVMAAIRIYIEKDYAGQGKDEKYLLGIIRGNSQQKPVANIPGGKVMKRTGSMLDKVYQEQGFTLI